jgi:hypothetical protein
MDVVKHNNTLVIQVSGQSLSMELPILPNEITKFSHGDASRIGLTPKSDKANSFLECLLNKSKSRLLDTQEFAFSTTKSKLHQELSLWIRGIVSLKVMDSKISLDFMPKEDSIFNSIAAIFYEEMPFDSSKVYRIICDINKNPYIYASRY